MNEKDLTGRTLHHYRVVEKLGEGGMGEVWVAEDLHLERRVALKLLPSSDEVDTGRLARFEREAKTIASLDHPNIVTLHSIETETTEADDDLRFLTMELVGGRRLDEVIHDDGLAMGEFLELAIPIADAVAAAHERGITHRDLKPANVVLTPDGRPKVLDFGLAKLLDDAVRDAAGDAPPSDADTVPRKLSQTLTRTATRVREVAGTVPYMAPEQLRGETGDRRTDVFSLGVLFHEMLTGSRPFDGDVPVATMAAILRDDPPRIRNARPGLPAALDELLRRCLAKDPDDRPADAGELRDELEELRRQWQTGALPRPPRSRAGRLAAAGLGIAATLALVALLFFFGLPGGGDRVAPPPDAAATAGDTVRIAVLPFESLGPSDDAYFAAGVAEEIRSRLAAVRELSVISRASVEPYVADGVERVEIGRALDVDYLLDGTVRWDRSAADDGTERVRVTPQLVRVDDGTQVWSTTFDRVLEDIFSVQSEIAGEVITQLDVTLFPDERGAVAGERPTESLAAYQAYLRARDHLNDSLYERRGYEAAIEELQRAVELDPGFAAAWAELSSSHSMMYHLGHDRTPSRQAGSLHALQRALELDPEAPRVRFARGYYRYRIQKDYPGALEDFRAVVDRLPSAADGIEAIAYVRRRQGDLEDAATHLRRALELNPSAGRLLMELATTELFLRRYASAEELFDRAILVSPNDPNLYRGKALNYWLWRGDLESAREILGTMPETGEVVNLWYLFHQHLFENDPAAILRLLEDRRELIRWTFFAYPASLLRGDAQALLGDEDSARQSYAEAAEILRREIEKSPEDARLHGALGLALAGLGEEDAALAAARRGVDLLPVERDAGTGPQRLYELALTQTRLGRLDDALETVRRLLAVPARVSKTFLELDPRFSPLVQHPGFDDLESDTAESGADSAPAGGN